MLCFVFNPCVEFLRFTHRCRRLFGNRRSQAHATFTSVIDHYQKHVGPDRKFEIDLDKGKSELLDSINELCLHAAVTKGEHQLAFILNKARESGVAAKSDKVLRYASMLSTEAKKPYEQVVHPDLAAAVKTGIEADTKKEKAEKAEKEKKEKAEKAEKKDKGAGKEKKEKPEKPEQKEKGAGKEKKEKNGAKK